MVIEHGDQASSAAFVQGYVAQCLGLYGTFSSVLDTPAPPLDDQFLPIRTQSYNYRHYAQRRIREEFRKNMQLALGSEAQTAAFAKAKEQAVSLQRQVAVSKLYPPNEPSVMESA